MDIIKVSARSRSTAVAGAIAGVIREHKHAEVQAVGAGAVNQAIKAAAIARGYLALDGIDIVMIPYFSEILIDNQERTAIRLVIEPRDPAATPNGTIQRSMPHKTEEVPPSTPGDGGSIAR